MCDNGVTAIENTTYKNDHNSDNSRQRETMLSDSLQKLMKSPTGTGRDCKLGTIINSLDKETSEILIEALSSNASTMGLVRALKDEGIYLSREYLGEKRTQCFKGSGSSACCLNSADKKEKNK